ncbi:MAG TPA: glycosyltransferase [bacterium]|nr:glycosyltransferase [bacterium]
MKVLHISTGDSGGAGLCCIRLHKGLLANGRESKVLVLNKTLNEPELYRFEQKSEKPPFPISFVWPYLALTARKFGIPLSRVERYRDRLNKLREGRQVFFTLPVSDLDLAGHPLVRETDIIHLHWVADFLDYPSFFAKVNKPIVWTVHDENLYMGGWHYRRAREEYPLLDELDDELASIKQRSLARQRKVTIVSLSRMMREFAVSHRSFTDREHRVIHNPVDHMTFRPVDKFFSRELLGLPKDKKILCFVSFGLWDTRKGLKELLVALKSLRRPDIVLCAVGAGDVKGISDQETFSLGLVRDERLMAAAYSAADLFVMPSFQEAFAQAPLEAMACGVPVVAFPCSGTEELINERNGIRTVDFTVESLREGIAKALNTKYDPEWIRNDVIERFGIEKIVSQYVDVYQQVLT